MSTSGAAGNISLEDGGTININVNDADASTTNETITNVELNGTDLEITEAGSTSSVSLATLQDGTGTDDQVASEVDVTPSGNLGSDNVQAALVELQTDINTLAAGGSDGNDFVTSGNLAGTNLTLNIPNQTNPVIDLSGLQDGTGTDDQALSTSGAAGNISLEDGGTININVNDADASTTNETITNVVLSGTDLEITEAGSTSSVSLATLQDGTGTDDQVAIEVDVTPSGNLGSDNVQAALEELQTDINTLAAGGSDGNDFVTSGNLTGTKPDTQHP